MYLVNIMYIVLIALVISIMIWDIKYNNKKDNNKMNIIKRWFIKWLGINKKLDINKRNIYIHDIQQRLRDVENFLEDNNNYKLKYRNLLDFDNK